MSRRSYSETLVFVDLSLNVLVGFIILFSLAFLSMQQKAKQEDTAVNIKAEFLITIEWPFESDDDVDAYMEDPMGKICFYGLRENGLMHLDRDDLGNSNDTVYLPDGTTYVVKENKEIVTIRGNIPGEYVVNAHMFRKRSKDPTVVSLKVEKINPRVRTIVTNKVKLFETGEEHTAFRFTVDNKGNVLDVKTDLPKAIAAKGLHYNTYTGEEYTPQEE